MTKTILIAGANGKIGRHAATAFAAAGWTVRSYQRGTDMTAAAQGADIILNGLNPPNYHNWAGLIPQITKQVIAAAQATGATVILPGNVYNYGNTCIGEWDEHTPHTPNTRKGKIRVEMEQAYRDSGVQTLILRAGNFIDPDGTEDIMSIIHLRSLAKGKLGMTGPMDSTQAWCYLPDWARAAVQLAEKKQELSQFEDIAFGGLAFDGHQLQAELQALTGLDLRVSQFPWWLMTALSPFWELAREMKEMRYLFALDHRLSDTRLHALLPGFTTTPLQALLRAKLDASLPEMMAVPA